MINLALNAPLLATRDRLLASASFQRWALRLPFLRPIARRRARALFDLCAGFVYSQVLFSCVQLRLFDLLRDGPRSLEFLAQRTALDPDALRTLLRAAAALELVRWRDGEDCGLGVHGATLLGNPSLMPMITHHEALYADLRDPVSLLRSPPHETHLSRYWAYARARNPAAVEGEAVRDYTELMSASQSLVADEILDAYPLNRHEALLDVGGGDGTFATLAARRLPRLRVTCFDLPAVAERARARIASAGVEGRVRAVGGDFHQDPLPRGADIVSLVRVLHDHEDAPALRILRAARAALPPRGAVLIAEPMSGTRGAERVADAYFGFYLLAMRSGKPRSQTELARLLRAAGFSSPRPYPTRMPMNVRVLVARCGDVKV